ncbi:Cytochrome c-type biogenesis protein DsbD, protein-disulfide reductase, partial [Oxalobacteraceae bacterium IMCC9480]
MSLPPLSSPSRLLRMVCSALLSLLLVLPALADEFLSSEQAFVFSARALDSRTVRLHWDIAPGYHLYRDRIHLQSAMPGVSWQAVTMPAGIDHFDANFNKTMVIYRHALDLDLHLTGGKALSPITAGWQGCAEAGLCYAPASADLQLALTSLGATTNAVTLAGTPATTPESANAAPDSITATLASGSLLRTIGVFWLAGVLLAFTPCVLPMVPILSSLIAGQRGPVSRRRGLLLALAYTLGMALVYAAFGVAAGLAGEGLAAALQNPWVLGGFAALLVALALSMFGWYDLQMPASIQGRATAWSNGFRGGSFVGVFVMGGISALVVGPCVAAPLAGALVYISQTRDVVLGGLALFAMALGMGLPLLLVGVSAGSLLPRAGAWMVAVKKLFGMVLLGIAIWMVMPVLPVSVQMLAWAAWLLVAAALLGLFGRSGESAGAPSVAARTGGAGLVALAIVLLLGAASGGRSLLQPLAQLRGPGDAARAQDALQFTRVTSTRELDAALAHARQQQQAVMLDFYADWCV